MKTGKEKNIYEKLRNLNDLKRGNVKGIYKQWIYKSKNNFHLSCDCLQKICYSIDDINSELSSNEFAMKEIVFIISLVDWIKGSYTKIKSLIRDDIVQKFSYSKANELEVAKEYFVAIRSYVVAHPMNTTKHNKFGLDGDFICLDLRTAGSPISLLAPDDKFFSIDYKGLHKYRNKKHSHYLLSYSHSIDGNKYFNYLSFDIGDILNVARLYIGAIYELDSLLARQKKKHYLIKIEKADMA